MFIDHLCLNDADLSAAIGQVDQPFVAQLELAFAAMRFIVIKWDQIRLSQRRVWLHAKLGRCHHSGKERLRSGLPKLGIGGKG